MADTVVSPVAIHPHDEGMPNISDGDEDWNSAGLQGLLAMGVHGKFIHGWGGFSGHDGTNDTVDVESFAAVLDLEEAGASVDVQSSRGGTSPPAYDTTLPAAGRMAIVVPKQTGLSVSSATLNPVWVAYATDGSVTGVAAGEVYLRHGSAETEPPSAHPSIKLGETNPDDSTADFHAGYENPPDVEGWREDPNSPMEQTVVDSQVDYNLVGRYDQVKVVGQAWTDRAQDAGFQIRINNNSEAVYDLFEGGSNSFTGLTQWDHVLSLPASAEDTDGTQAGGFSFILDGKWNPSTPQPSFVNLTKTVLDTGGAVETWDGGVWRGGTGLTSGRLHQINFIPTNNTGYHVTVLGRHTSRPNVG